MAKQKLLPYVDEKGDRHDHYFYDPDTEIIQFSKRHNGRKIKFTTHIKRPNIKKAKVYANSEFDRRIGKNRSFITPLIKDQVPLFLKVKEAEGLDEKGTLKNVRNALKQIEPFWGNKFPHEITRDNLSEWYSWFQREYPTQQMENAIKYMRNFCRYLAEKQHNGYPLLPAVPKITDPNGKKVKAARTIKKERILTPEEFKTIFESASSDEERVMALFMYTMASRVDETLKLRFGIEVVLDTNPPEYRWRPEQNKADLNGKHHLHPSLIPLLSRLYEMRKGQGTDRLFPQQRNNQAGLRAQQVDWDGWRERAKLGWHWTAHTFRHTCLSTLFNDERNPQLLICKLYRISLQEAARTYVKPTLGGIEKMRTAITVNLEDSVW